MIIDLFPTQNSPSGSGKDGSQQGNVALINGVIEAGKAMVSYEAACTMLMELVPIVADNKEELALLLRGKEELKIMGSVLLIIFKWVGGRFLLWQATLSVTLFR